MERSAAAPVPAMSAATPRVQLRVVPAPSAGAYWRRRAVLVALLLVLVLTVTVVVGRTGADADLAQPVAGHVVIAPGQTLWDAAAATAPPGMDVRAHLAVMRALNGLPAGDVPAWTVVLVPAY